MEEILINFRGKEERKATINIVLAHHHTKAKVHPLDWLN
jgi:hypothetical protein